ncbi:MAG: outer membrane lipoprotein-sorting protein [Verrucomicrobiota bacterium]
MTDATNSLFEKSIGLALVGLILMPFTPGMAKEPPPAAAVLEAVRTNQVNQMVQLQGKLSTYQGRKRAIHPFGLSMKGPEMRFAFANPAQTITRLVKGNRCVISEGFNGAQEKAVSSKDYGLRIRGTDLNFEDLSLRFLYWNQAEMLGEDVVNEKICWKIRLTNPGAGPYGSVLVWIDQVYYTLWQVEGSDRNGRTIKRFQVARGQRVTMKWNGRKEKRWILREMSIQSFHPNTGRMTGRTKLLLDKPIQ